MAGTEIITDRSRRAKGCSYIIVGAIFGGFSAAIGTIGLTSDATIGTIGFGLFMGLFALVGAAIVIGGARSVRLSHVLGVPTLILPPGEPLCLGSVLVARFHRSGGTPRAQRAPRLSAVLVCQEQVTYRQGTDDHTVTHQIHRRELAVTPDQVPDTVSGQVVIEVPVDAPPSLTLAHNRIIWSVRVQVQVQGVPDDTGTFQVPVLPVVAARRLGDGGPAGRAPGAPQ